MRKHILLTIAIMMLLMLVAPVGGAQDNSVKGLAVRSNGEPMVLGFVANEIRSGWMSAAVGYMGSLWERAGGKFIAYVSEYDVSLELSQVNDLIQLSPDAIVFHPSDSAAIASGVEKANKLGIPTFAVDVGVVGSPVTSFIHIDQTRLGAVNAKYLAKKFSEENPAKIIQLMGGLEQDIAIQRREGFNEVVAQYPYLNILTEIDTKWSSEKALSAVMDALERFPDANVIYCHSDFMIQGIIEGLRLKGRLVPAGEDGHITICSIDGDPNGLDAMRKGYVDTIAEHNPALHSATAFQAILSVLHGNEVPSDIRMEPPLITVDNVDSSERWGNLPSGKFDEWPVLEQEFYNMPK